jgi:glycosyltransferase involved in cell wall biosynthesis
MCDTRMTASVSPTAELPLPAGTEFHLQPAQRDLAGLYARCDAWLFPSRVDSFGLPIVEDNPYGDLWFDAPPPPPLSASATEIWSLRRTSTAAPSWARYCTRLKTNES